ncbi:Glu-tRNA(Gln) amidotransferase subunit GatD [Candidatus Micrarchaeota archaeon]|nr:Glu-tRNA(Gln) amidotransferase subunit GatD [Candidatus Micrarchaeota archaeon]
MVFLDLPGYGGIVKQALEKAGAQVGSQILVKTKQGSFEGVLLPKTAYSASGLIVLKLDSGYNTAITFSAGDSIEKIGGGSRLESRPSIVVKARKDLPKISLVSTGGTIAARVDYRLGGVKTVLTPQEILETTPELSQIVSLTSIKSPFIMWSENFSPQQWIRMAKECVSELNSGVNGVVLTQGTDTIGYTSAALSFMIKDQNKPVVVTGAQRSPDRGSFDGKQNLICSSVYAANSNTSETVVAFHSSSSDGSCDVMRGTKVRKMHSTRRDAFKSINDSPIARVYPSGKIDFLQKTSQSKKEDCVLDAVFEEKTTLVKAYPGSNPELIDFFVDKKYRGIVVEATALGQVPTHTSDEKFSWSNSIKRAIDDGVVVAFATQCLYGVVSPYVYEGAREMDKLGVVYCSDMLSETAFVKLGWLLGHKGFDEKKVSALMKENLRGEYNPRLKEREFE